MKRILYILAVLAIVACSKEISSEVKQDLGSGEKYRVKLETSICGFDGESKVNTAGTGFVSGDRIRIKMICPFVSNVLDGENTPLPVMDHFWMLKWNGSDWTNLTTADGCDLDGDYIASSSTPITTLMLAQQTMYVFTASTWSEEVFFVESSGSSPILQFNNVFHADQSVERNYQLSDVLWAQQLHQTGPEKVFLNFHHVMCALEIHVNDTKGVIADNAVITLEGMPEMDLQEIVVGDYYANACKYKMNYGYSQKCGCVKADNGKVLGISYIDQSAKSAGVTAISALPRTGTFKAFNAGGMTWRVIVPPCAFNSDVVIWLRSGEKRYSMTLTNPTFEQGKLYPIEMKIQ